MKIFKKVMAATIVAAMLVTVMLMPSSALGMYSGYVNDGTHNIGWGETWNNEINVIHGDENQRIIRSQVHPNSSSAICKTTIRRDYVRNATDPADYKITSGDFQVGTAYCTTHDTINLHIYNVTTWYKINGYYIRVIGLYNYG